MSWDNQRRSKEERLNAAAALCSGKTVATENIVKLMEAVIHPGDKVVLEGDNQKQAAFLAASLAEVDPKVVHDLTMIIPSISRSEHLDYFEKGIASTVDFAFAGTQAQRLSEMLAEGKVKIGNFNTYLEIYARLFVDLIPNVCLVAADKADKDGNLFTGYSTEETPTLVEAAACKSGIVIAQVNEIVEDLPRVDIPGGWVDFIVPADKPYPMEPLFTRDPQFIKDADILMGMMVIKGIYAKHGVKSLNHGIGFNGAAIELLLPTYGEQLGLKGKICRNWVLNPHPTLIPAIEAGWVESICAFGGEVGMEKYTEERSDIFFTGADGTLRSNRTLAQVAGLYAIDSFLGATLQMDYYGNSSTVTAGRLSGFGGAPNMGHNPGGRRHSSPAYHSLVEGKDTLHGGQKIVIQMLKSSGKKGNNFVPELDAIAIGRDAGMEAPPIMVYGEDVSHTVTEQGIAYCYMAEDAEERRLMLASIAQGTPFGEMVTKEQIEDLMKINDDVETIFTRINVMLRNNDFADIELILELRDELFESIAEAIKRQLKRIKNKESSTKASLLYLTILNETKTMVLQARNLVKSQRYFLEHKTE